MPNPAGLAILHYETPDFDIVQPGDFVLCAVTGTRIALDELRYWSATYQEAYCDGPTAVAAILAGGATRLKAPGSTPQ